MENHFRHSWHWYGFSSTKSKIVIHNKTDCWSSVFFLFQINKVLSFRSKLSVSHNYLSWRVSLLCLFYTCGEPYVCVFACDCWDSTTAKICARTEGKYVPWCVRARLSYESERRNKQSGNSSLHIFNKEISLSITKLTTCCITEVLTCTVYLSLHTFPQISQCCRKRVKIIHCKCQYINFTDQFYSLLGQEHLLFKFL